MRRRVRTRPCGAHARSGLPVSQPLVLRSWLAALGLQADFEPDASIAKAALVSLVCSFAQACTLFFVLGETSGMGALAAVAMLVLGFTATASGHAIAWDPTPKPKPLALFCINTGYHLLSGLAGAGAVMLLR